MRATVVASMFRAEIGFVEVRPQITGFCNRAAKILIICVLAWRNTRHAYSLELTRKEFPDHCCALLLIFEFAHHEFAVVKDCSYSDQIKNTDIHKQFNLVQTFDLAFEVEELVLSNFLDSLCY